MTDFGRPDASGRWPRRLWRYTCGWVLLSTVAGIAVGQVQYSRMADVQQLYLPYYLKSTIVAQIRPQAPVTYVLATGYPVTRTHGLMRKWLQESVYGQSVTHLLYWPFAVFASLLLPGLCLTVPKDRRRAKDRRQGMRRKGPELVTARNGDGIGWQQGTGVITALDPRATWVRTDRALESSHFMLLGDSGSGKSSLIRQQLVQIAEAGERAVVYDAKREYIQQFFSAERGDVVLNPLDARCPYWTPSDELETDEDAYTLAASLFPDRPNDDSFFTKAPRDVFALLLRKFHPTAADIVGWLRNEAELLRRLAGESEFYNIDPHAGAQRGGVMAELNFVSRTLKLLPEVEASTPGRWSARQWVENGGTGWIFLTTRPQNRAVLLPILSLWLDLLVMRLMTREGTPSPVWLFIDEFASLQRLPQFQIAVTEGRSANLRVVIGCQGRGQVEGKYGVHDAEVLLSQPATKIILRTSEPRAAKWASELLGEVEQERIEQSHSKGQSSSQSERLVRESPPSVMASEISGLANLHGYCKIGNSVIPMEFPFLSLPNHTPGLVLRERPVEPDEPEEPVREPVRHAPARHAHFLR